jgi:hypothetical protein
MHPALLRFFSEQPAAAPLLVHGEAYSPARLFKAVYCSNLLRNGEFLERTNSTRSTCSGGSARSMTWVRGRDYRAGGEEWGWRWRWAWRSPLGQLGRESSS